MKEIEDTRIVIRCVNCDNLFNADIATLQEGKREVECTHCHYKQPVYIEIQTIKRAIVIGSQRG